MRKQEAVPMATQDSPNLYERLGGVYSIATVVDDLIDRVMADPRLNANPIAGLSVALFHPALTREASMFEAGDQDRETNRHVDRIQDRHQIGRGEIGKHERLAR